MPKEKVTPGVVFKSRFVFSDLKFTNYINYIDRPEAVRNAAYSLYSVYASKRQPETPERTSALFTGTKDRLTLDEKKSLKKQFQIAQDAGSPMWQQIISFTTDFLHQNGLYDPKTKQLDEEKIREVTRTAVQEMLKDEHMEGSAVWSASIHYNTKHIHVHLAIVEPHPTRRVKEVEVEGENGEKVRQQQYRGSMKKATFSKVKSKIVNSIVDMPEQLKEINNLIRKNIVAEKRQHLSTKDKNLRGAFLNLYSKLPSDKRMWNYNMNALHDVRPEIDRFSKMYLELYHRDDLKKLSDSLHRQEEFLMSAYGAGKKEELYKNYSKNKMDELYTRMGNAVLRELREYDKTVRGIKARPKMRDPKERLRYQKHISQTYQESWYDLKRALRKDFTSVKNQMSFEKLQTEIQRAEQEVER